MSTREERRKEPRVRRRLRATIESPSGRTSAVLTSASEHGVGVSVETTLPRGARVVVTVLLPTGRVTFEAIVRHSRRATEPGGGFRGGLELAQAAPEPYRRFVRDELAALLARSGAAEDDAPDGAAPTPPAPRGRRGIPSPIALRIGAAASVAPAPAPSPAPAGGARKGRKSSGRRMRPKTPPRSAVAATGAAGELARVEPGLHGIASIRSVAGIEDDALLAATVMREAALQAVEGLLPAGARLTLVSADVALEPGPAGAGATLAATARLATVETVTATLRFEAEVTRQGRTVARGRMTFRSG